MFMGNDNTYPLTGWWAQGWHLPLLELMPNVEIVAIIEPSIQPRSTLVENLDSVDKLSVKYSCPIYTDIESLLQSKIDIDGIIICTPHATHSHIGIIAIEAGLHVLCEKPMTTDIDEAIMLASSAFKRPEQIFMVNNTANWRSKSKLIRERYIYILGYLYIEICTHTQLYYIMDMYT
jgi:predicted dehydrogenase